VAGTLTIEKKELTAIYTGETVTYGTEPALVVEYTGFVYGENESVIDVSATVTNTNTDVGVYTLTPAGAADSNYSFTYVAGTLTIEKKELTATYKGDTVIYGTDPDLVVEYTGFVYEDDESAIDTLATVANTNKDVGVYTLTPAGAADSNYSFTYVAGTLTITKAEQDPLVITSVEGKNDESDPFKLEVTGGSSTGLVTFTQLSGEDVATVAEDGTVTIIKAGEFTVKATKAGGNNYFDVVSEELTIVIAKSDNTILKEYTDTLTDLDSQEDFADEDFYLDTEIDSITVATTDMTALYDEITSDLHAGITIVSIAGEIETTETNFLASLKTLMKADGKTTLAELNEVTINIAVVYAYGTASDMVTFTLTFSDANLIHRASFVYGTTVVGGIDNKELYEEFALYEGDTLISLSSDNVTSIVETFGETDVNITPDTNTSLRVNVLTREAGTYKYMIVLNNGTRYEAFIDWAVPVVQEAVLQNNGEVVKCGDDIYRLYYIVQLDTTPGDTLVFRQKPTKVIDVQSVLADGDTVFNIYFRPTDASFEQLDGLHTYIYRKGGVWYTTVIEYSNQARLTAYTSGLTKAHTEDFVADEDFYLDTEIDSIVGTTKMTNLFGEITSNLLAGTSIVSIAGETESTLANFVSSLKTLMTEDGKARLSELNEVTIDIDVVYAYGTASETITYKLTFDTSELGYPTGIVNMTKSKSYNTIQEAVGDADANDTVTLAAGDYQVEWDGTIGLKIYKNLTLEGASEDSVTLRPASKGNPSSHRFIQTGGDNPNHVNIKNLTIDGFLADGTNGGIARGINLYNYGAGLGSSINLENVTIQNVVDATEHNTTGLYLLTGGNTISEIKNVTIKNYGWTGLMVASFPGYGDQTININGLHIDGKNDADHLTNGIDARSTPYRNLTINANNLYIENSDYVDAKWVATAIILSPEQNQDGGENVKTSFKITNSVIKNSINAVYFESSMRADSMNISNTIFDNISGTDIIYFGKSGETTSTFTISNSYTSRGKDGISYLDAKEGKTAYEPTITDTYDAATYPTENLGKDDMSFELSNKKAAFVEDLQTDIAVVNENEGITAEFDDETEIIMVAFDDIVDINLVITTAGALVDTLLADAGGESTLTIGIYTFTLATVDIGELAGALLGEVTLEQFFEGVPVVVDYTANVVYENAVIVLSGTLNFKVNGTKESFLSELSTEIQNINSNEGITAELDDNENITVTFDDNIDIGLVITAAEALVDALLADAGGESTLTIGEYTFTLATVDIGELAGALLGEVTPEQFLSEGVPVVANYTANVVYKNAVIVLSGILNFKVNGTKESFLSELNAEIQNINSNEGITAELDVNENITVTFYDNVDIGLVDTVTNGLAQALQKFAGANSKLTLGTKELALDTVSIYDLAKALLGDKIPQEFLDDDSPIVIEYTARVKYKNIDVELEGTLTITKAEQDPLVITSVEGKNDESDPFELEVTGGSGTGLVTFTQLSGEDIATVAEDGTVTIKKAGEFTVKATKAGGNNYFDVVSEELTIVIAKSDKTILAEAKTVKIAAIDAILLTYTENDYNEDNWDTLNGHITTAIETVNACETIEAVEAIDLEAIEINCYNVHAINRYVSTKAEFEAAVTISDRIILLNDIKIEDGEVYKDTGIAAYTQNLDLVIDLNTFTYEYEIDLKNKDGYSLDIEIKNGTLGALDKSVLWYGILVNGDDKLNATLNNVTVNGWYGGLYTNGAFKDSSITANNCSFNGGGGGADSVGAYLAANYEYKFTDCTFDGASGIHIKSGTLTLNNCILTADGEYAEPQYHGSGANITGNGLMAEPTVGYFEPLIITVNGGSITSANGYAVGEHASAGEGVTPNAYATVTINGTTLTGAKGEVLSDNDKVTIVEVED
ncbi:MAG: MBG domain-containing protein, partial [Clostridia bacterium]